MTLRARCLAVMTAAALAGCSEKTPEVLVWEPAPPGAFAPKVAFTDVAAWSADGAIAVGYQLPEFSLFALPVAYEYSGAQWRRMTVPGHAGQSFQLLAVTRDARGEIWACGVVQNTLEQTETARPVVVRLTAGAWTEVPLDELGDQTGLALRNIAAAPAGRPFELRAVGVRADLSGAILRYDGTQWSVMDVPAPASAQWSLFTVGCSPRGVWYAAGLESDATTGTIFRDGGSGGGWITYSDPALRGLQFESVAFDGAGTAWFACNRSGSDILEGVLLRFGDGLESLAVRRLTAGPSQFFGIGFSAQGYGWIVGGRAPDDPFVAGNAAGPHWTEVLAESELQERMGGAFQEEGGELLAVSVVARNSAFAVGRAEERDAEGNTEIVPRAFRLIAKPPGETDKPSPVSP